MKTIYGLDVLTQWDQILLRHCLSLAKDNHPDWYRWRLSNNYERAIFLKGDPVLPRESSRYCWANRNLIGIDVLEIGCSTGYGSQFLPNNIVYTGIDYDPIIVDVAQDQKWGESHLFISQDINNYEFDRHDTIIAFEVIEHLENGLNIVEKLKTHCKRLLITVPHLEPKGFWGEHHKLHGLSELDFPGFTFEYISESGHITDQPKPINESNRCNLMIGKWDE